MKKRVMLSLPLAAALLIGSEVIATKYTKGTTYAQMVMSADQRTAQIRSCEIAKNQHNALTVALLQEVKKNIQRHPDIKTKLSNFETWKKTPCYQWKKINNSWKKTFFLSDHQENHQDLTAPLSHIRKEEITRVAQLEIFKKGLLLANKQIKERKQKEIEKNNDKINKLHQEQTKIYTENGSWFPSYH